ncbi:MAG: hypothetical protein ACKO3B_13370 [Bacteroidota bacterium]
MTISNLKKILIRYVAEIVVIFMGITISFIFDQWREEQRARKEELEFIESLRTDLQVKRSEIQSDNPYAMIWVNRLDSLQQERISGKFHREHLIWFYKTMLRGGKFFFNSTTPTYAAAEKSGIWQQLPDSIRRKIYHIYMEDFKWNSLAYEQLSIAMNEFRNSVMTASGILSLDLGPESAASDIKLFEQEISRPEYGSVIQNIIEGEQYLFRKGESSISDINELIEDLDLIIEELNN